MPTLLGLCDIPAADCVEGLDFSDYVAGGDAHSDGAALLMSPHPFGQWNSMDQGGKEYRGLRTRRYTYVHDRQGPWLLYDNDVDPFQKQNLVHHPGIDAIRNELDRVLTQKLKAQHDEFLPGMEYIEKWGYPVNETGTVPYTN